MKLWLQITLMKLLLFTLTGETVQVQEFIDRIEYTLGNVYKNGYRVWQPRGFSRDGRAAFDGYSDILVMVLRKLQS